MHCPVQAAVEDGLVHVDVALPDYKIALFLENAHEQQRDGHTGLADPDVTALEG